MLRNRWSQISALSSAHKSPSHHSHRPGPSVRPEKFEERAVDVGNLENETVQVAINLRKSPASLQTAKKTRQSKPIWSFVSLWQQRQGHQQKQSGAKQSKNHFLFGSKWTSTLTKQSKSGKKQSPCSENVSLGSSHTSGGDQADGSAGQGKHFRVPMVIVDEPTPLRIDYQDSHPKDTAAVAQRCGQLIDAILRDFGEDTDSQDPVEKDGEDSKNFKPPLPRRGTRPLQINSFGKTSPLSEREQGEKVASPKPRYQMCRTAQLQQTKSFSFPPKSRGDIDPPSNSSLEPHPALCGGSSAPVTPAAQHSPSQHQRSLPSLGQTALRGRVIKKLFKSKGKTDKAKGSTDSSTPKTKRHQSAPKIRLEGFPGGDSRSTVC